MKIELPKELVEKIEKIMKSAGYDTVEEYAIYVLEKVVAKSSEQESEDTYSEEEEEEIKERLRGLGYLD